MRIHRLEFQAIGPFPGHHDIDFDSLSQAGLFLLTGQTGAGKSTIIDAIVFGLYGSLAGANSDPARLRCKLAEGTVPSFVELTFSTGAGIYRLRRTPAYERPKQRGTGTTTEKSTVKLSKLPSSAAGHGEVLSTSAQEIGRQIIAIVGLNKEQFTQTAVLPQGQFAEFLHAKPEDRRKVLQQVFSTSIYEELQNELTERAKEVRSRADRLATQVRTKIELVAGAAGQKESWRGYVTGLFDSSRTLEAVEVCAGLVADSGATARALRHRERQAKRAKQAADAALSAGQQTQQRQARAAELSAQRRALVERAEEVASQRARLDAHRRALPVVQANQKYTADRALLPAAQGAWQEAQAAALGALAQVGIAQAADADSTANGAQELGRLRDLAVGRHGSLATAQQQEKALAQLARQVAQATKAVEDAKGAHQQAAQAVAALPAKTKQCEEELARATAQAALLGQAQLAVRDLEGAQKLAGQHATAVSALQKAGNGVESTLAALEAARRSQQQTLGLWLAGSASALAGRLEDGKPCLVCGSTAHPAPATSQADGTAVSEAEVTAAAQLAEQAAAAHSAALAKQTSCQEKVEELAAQLADVEVDSLAARLEEARAALGEAQQAGQRVTTLRQEEQELRDQHSALTEQLHHAQINIQTRTSELALAEENQAATAKAVQEARGQAQSVSAIRAELLSAARKAEDALALNQTWQDAAAQAVRSQEAVAQALAASGFANLEGALAVVLPAERASQLETELQQYDTDLLKAETALNQPELVAAAAQPAPDLERLQADAQAAADQADAAVSAAATAADAAGRVATAYLALREATAQHQKAVAGAQSLLFVAAAVAGSGANQKQIPLASFVLLSRFDEVLAAANPRILAISNGRYELARTDDEGGQRARLGGLGLAVIDHHTRDDAQRSPRTLSGGETFYFSLSLALALAEVVRQEAGGVEIGTLFIDEGFGSLDADTLDEVMNQISALREGGRAVGLISHVAEMAQRIPDGIKVTRSRTGSTLTVTAG
ncbi:SMC family ATPase [Buchananella felis]|uniref:AAA family ATPase n=1 Tax=Buchananella felis TaxID=3231492 RepID=UPI003527A2EE